MMPTDAEPTAASAVRQKYIRVDGAQLVGHFGTFGAGLISRQLAAVLPAVLEANTGRFGLLIGRGSAAFKDRIVTEHPALAERLYATNELAAEAVSVHLSACDLLLQPYPDGVSGRRTSLMAGLALGLPIITTHGPATETVWEQGLVALAPANDPAGFVAVAERLLADPTARRQLGETGRAGYQAHFSIDCTIRVLRACGAASAEKRTPPLAAASSCLF